MKTVSKVSLTKTASVIFLALGWIVACYLFFGQDYAYEKSRQSEKAMQKTRRDMNELYVENFAYMDFLEGKGYVYRSRIQNGELKFYWTKRD